MRKEREELRRGIRAFIQDTSAELAEFTSSAPPALPQKPPAAREPAPADRPILRLVRDAPWATLETARGGGELTRHPKKGGCPAYFANKKCWELSEGFCNQTLHICSPRESPV